MKIILNLKNSVVFIAVGFIFAFPFKLFAQGDIDINLKGATTQFKITQITFQNVTQDQVIGKGEKFIPEAVVEGQGTGTVQFTWVIDGIPKSSGSAQMLNGQSITLKSTDSFINTLIESTQHSYYLKVTYPNEISSDVIKYTVGGAMLPTGLKNLTVKNVDSKPIALSLGGDIIIIPQGEERKILSVAQDNRITLTAQICPGVPGAKSCVGINSEGNVVAQAKMGEVIILTGFSEIKPDGTSVESGVCIGPGVDAYILSFDLSHCVTTKGAKDLFTIEILGQELSLDLTPEDKPYYVKKCRQDEWDLLYYNTGGTGGSITSHEAENMFINCYFTAFSDYYGAWDRMFFKSENDFRNGIQNYYNTSTKLGSNISADFGNVKIGNNRIIMGAVFYRDMFEQQKKIISLYYKLFYEGGEWFRSKQEESVAYSMYVGINNDYIKFYEGNFNITEDYVQKTLNFNIITSHLITIKVVFSLKGQSLTLESKPL